MKAIIIATGETVEVVKDGLFYNVIDGYERYYEHELDFQDVISYWTRLEHQYAGMAMQGIVSNPSIELDYKGDEGCIHAVAIVAGKFAHALVEKMKEVK